MTMIYSQLKYNTDRHFWLFDTFQVSGIVFIDLHNSMGLARGCRPATIFA